MVPIKILKQAKLKLLFCKSDNRMFWLNVILQSCMFDSNDSNQQSEIGSLHVKILHKYALLRRYSYLSQS